MLYIQSDKILSGLVRLISLKVNELLSQHLILIFPLHIDRGYYEPRKSIPPTLIGLCTLRVALPHYANILNPCEKAALVDFARHVFEHSQDWYSKWVVGSQREVLWK